MNQTYVKNLSQILEIENSSDLLSITCPKSNIPLWALIRIHALRLIIGDIYYENSIISNENHSSGKLDKSKILLKSVINNHHYLKSLNKNKDIIIMSTGSRLIKKDGKYFNPLSDYFFSSSPESTVIVEDLHNWLWPFPRINEDILISMPYKVHGYIAGYIRSNCITSQSIDRLIDIFDIRCQKILGWKIGKKRKSLHTACSIAYMSLQTRYKSYAALFKLLGAKILIKEEASYGGATNLAAILAARDRGMIIVEYQHGAISKGHDAYNFAEAVMVNQNYLKVLPDYFLAYGPWWVDQINLPAKPVVIGNPHRPEFLSNLGLYEARPQKKILVLGDGLDTFKYLQLCKNITALKLQYEVIFRPHPGERKKFESKAERDKHSFLIDTQKNIFDTFCNVDVVISEISTGLFDAIGIVEKILVWQTEKADFFYQNHPFDRFKNIEDLLCNLEKPSIFFSKQKIDYFWASNWRNNYLQFLTEIL